MDHIRGLFLRNLGAGWFVHIYCCAPLKYTCPCPPVPSKAIFSYSIHAQRNAASMCQVENDVYTHTMAFMQCLHVQPGTTRLLKCTNSRSAHTMNGIHYVIFPDSEVLETEGGFSSSLLSIHSLCGWTVRKIISVGKGASVINGLLLKLLCQWSDAAHI